MRRFFLSSLRARVMLLVLLAVVPALSLILYTAHERRQQAATEAQESLLGLARNASDDYRWLIEGTRQLLMVLARLPAVRQHDPAACSTVMADLVKNHPHYLGLGALKPNGDRFCGYPGSAQAVNVADRPWFRQVLQTRDFTTGNYQVGRVTRQAVLPFAYPALDDAGKVRAVVLAIVGLNWLKQMGSKALLPRDSTLTLFDSSGVILGQHPGGDERVRTPVRDPVLIQALQGRAQGVAVGSNVAGVPHFIGFTSLKDGGGGEVKLVIAIPQKAIFAEADRVLRRNLLWLGIVSLIALAVAWFGCERFILRQLNSLVGASQRLGSGELNARTGLPRGTGELAHLAQAFDDMAEALQRRQIEARQADEALRHAEAKYRGIFEHAAEGIFQATTDGRIVTANPALARMLGYGSADELIASLTDLEHQLYVDADRRTELARLLGDADAVTEFEVQCCRRDGTKIWVLANVRAVHDADRTVLYYEGTVQDITERKQAETEVRAQARQQAAVALLGQRALTGSDLDALFAETATLVGQTLQAEYCGITEFLADGQTLRLRAGVGWKEGSLVNATVEAGPHSQAGYTLMSEQPVVVEDLRTETRFRASQLLLEHGVVSGMTTIIGGRHHLFGVLGVYTTTLRKFSGDDVNFLQAVANVLADAIERKRGEESVRQLSSRLLQLQDEEQQRIARELQTATAQTLDALLAQLSIVRNSGIVFDWKTADALQKSLSLARDAVREVRSLSNLLYPRLLDEAGLIEAIRGYGGSFIERTGIKVVMDIPARFGRLSRDAERALFRVVQESLTNIFRHSGSETAHVRLTEDTYAVRLEVKDNGGGIPPGILEASSGTVAMSGVGIRGMVERMRQLGGRVDIDSGKLGTTVTASLPVSSARPAGQAG